MSASIRGDKGHVRIIKNGQEVAWFEITSVDDADESQHVKSHYVGRKRPETDVFEMGYNGTITGEVKNEVVDALMEEVRVARKSGVAIPQIAIMVYMEYPDGAINGQAGRTTIFTDVQFTSSGHLGGATEKVTKTLQFSAADKKLIP